MMIYQVALIVVSMGSFFSSYGLHLDRAILATNDNPNYIQFWPIAAKAWQEIVGVRPTLALIATPDVEVDESLGDVIRFEPIEGIPTSLHAQCIRLLLPCLFPDEVCILTDIDLIPLQKKFFTKNIAKFPENNFVIYRDLEYSSWYSHLFIKNKRYYMNYNAAKGSTFREIFGVTSIEQIPEVIKSWQKLGFGWDTDEKVLYRLIKEWRKKNKHRVKKLGYGKDPKHRITRGNDLKYSKKKLAKGYYVEVNCSRPYKEYKETIDHIIQLALLAAA